MGALARLCAALIAAAALAGLAIQFGVTLNNVGSPLTAVVLMSRYFTILTNLAIVVVFAAIALGPRGLIGARLVAGLALSIAMVGVVNGVLLRGLTPQTGGWLAADTLMHVATPVLTPLYWLVFSEKGALRRLDPLWFAAYPLIYLAVALYRGVNAGAYPYPFLNVALRGWPTVLTNVAVIGLGFFVAAVALVLLDRLLGARDPRPS